KNGFDLLDQVAGDAGALKNWENRALLAALAGDLLWEKDKKRARELFRNSANEMTQANNLPADKSKPDEQMFFGAFNNTSPRRTILQTIAGRDADLALQFLLETRPAKLQEAITAQNQLKNQPAKPKTADDLFSGRSQQFQVQQEISLEQSFASRAAEQNPKKAAQLLRDSLSKGVTQEVFNLLEKIHKKDHELAKQLTGEVVAKLLEIDFVKDESTRGVALRFLTQYGLPKSQPTAAKSDSTAAKTDSLTPKTDDKTPEFKVDEKLLKDTAAKFADYLMQANGFEAFIFFNAVMPTIEKFAPEKVLQLKQKQAANRKAMPLEFQAMEESFGSTMGNNKDTAPEKLIADAAKLPTFARARTYNQAVDKMVAAGTADKARALLQNAPEGKERDDALSYLDSRLAAGAIEKGNLEEAQKIVGQIGSDKEKVEQLVNLAVKFHQKNTKESHEAALKIMEEARRLVNEFAENKDEVAGVLKLAAGFAVIEPDRAFPLLNPLIEQANDVISATALLAKYNKREQMFKQGEMLLPQTFGGGSFARYGRELKMLAQIDYGKTRGLIDQFRRDDVRVLLKMLLAQSILSDKIGFEGSGGFVGFGSDSGGIIINN
ncbi:MAG: hypothetical protein M3525_12905, partial [Acidobacteriota bacterium]|nr:hypothetical protein [Acidobacteriota bacterium]